MDALVLYTRPDCHLCDEASELLARQAPGRELKLVDIEQDLGLIDRYGRHVPVLSRASDGGELRWPFDAKTLDRFLDAG